MGILDWQKWFYDYEKALEAARKCHKPVLMQFHREKCSGCRKLYAVTYPDEKVDAELHSWFVPLRLDILENRQVRSRYSAYWTPSFFIIDDREKMYTAFNGFLQSEDFRVFLRLGYAAYLIPRGKYLETIKLMEDGLKQFPNNPRSATMLFTRGIAEYLNEREKDSFYLTMTEIQERYPDSLEARMWPWMDE